MRALRFGLGLVVIVVALWIIVAEQISGASANAFINARLTTLRSPIAGEVSFAQSTLGARVEPQETVATVEDQRADRIRRDDLAMEVALTGSEIERVESQIVALDTTRRQLEGRLEDYRAARLEELRIALSHARERLALLQDEGELLEDDAEAAAVVDDTTERTPGEPVTYPLALEYAQERVEVLETTLAALEEDGVYLGDGYNDAPYSEQRLNELDAELTDLRTRLSMLRSQRQTRADRLEQARGRDTLLSGADLISPVEGLLWEFRASGGEIVQRGDPVVTLADCGSLVVSLSVTETVYNSLQLGQSATFRPSGSSRTFAGTVTRLAGSGAQTIYRNLAVAPGERHLERFDVTLLVPGLSSDPELSCAIGRTGRVFFESRPLDWLRNLGQ
ncbi:HlyD family efflux transporter periplasmic adaptor subunit [Histidinibacterium aquaticum]|uniref:HlyD family efflux transporter periplasmic adaptor subunit n=1 Tax=Histidinibacterium aquaticum TaxID=2613962 RepID=A0A5J5GK99_9RHOB|nr:HlyD family secretion protein [Histidinibacterium aquaticum]KAA9008093.1 HlyD family efflux transporter periplasmic adaptor subunit [Histidinibacterium aquaticum]